MLDINPVQKPNIPQDPEKNQNSFSHHEKNQESEVGDLFFEENANISKLVFNFSIAVLIIVLVFGGYLYFSTKNKESAIRGEDSLKKELTLEINTPELANIESLATQYSLGLDEVASLINNPIQYSLLFVELEKIIPSDVTLTGLTVDDKNKVAIIAETTNLEASAKFVKAMETSKMFSGVVLDNSQQSGSSSQAKYYTMNLSANCDAKMLKANSKKTVTPTPTATPINPPKEAQ